MLRITKTFLLLFTFLPSMAQTFDLEDLLEPTGVEEVEIRDQNHFLEGLEYYRLHPLDLNKAEEEDLAVLFFLTELQIRSILEYRAAFGRFMNIYELQVVHNLELNTIKQLLEFATVNADIDHSNENLRQLLTQGEHQILVRTQRILEQKEGYANNVSENSRYLGSPYRLLVRHTYSYGKRLRFGFMGEKDSGEEFFKGSQPAGFDFLSGYIYYRSNKIIKYWVAGDYQLNFGQGMLIWSGFSFGKSSLIQTGVKRAYPISPYSSVNETDFFRGTAIQLAYKKVRFTGFISYAPVDANISTYDSLNSTVVAVSSFRKDGYHRSLSELRDKNSISVLLFGNRIEFRSRTMDLGLTIMNTRLSAPLIASNNVLYKTFDFQGRNLSHLGLDFNITHRNMHLFGETALNNKRGIALLTGAILSLDKNIDALLVYRNYSRAYFSFFSRLFGDYYKGQNESGLYYGLNFKIGSSFTLFTYIDNYKHPWLKFKADRPSSGSDALLQLNYKPRKQLIVYYKVRYELTNKNSLLERDKLKVLNVSRVVKSRFNFEHNYSKHLRLKTRVDWVVAPGKKVKYNGGFMLSQEVKLKLTKIPLTVSTRISFFDVKDYEYRIYSYEQDLLHSFSIPSFSNKGTRSYLLLHYRFSKHLDSWLKYSRTYYSNKETIGTGSELINSKSRSELKFQLRIRFGT